MRPAAALASEGIDMPLVIWFTIHLVLRSAACVGEVAFTRPGDIKVVGALSLSPPANTHLARWSALSFQTAP